MNSFTTKKHQKEHLLSGLIPYFYQGCYAQTYIHTHTHTHTYIYVCVCVCVCVWSSILLDY